MIDLAARLSVGLAPVLLFLAVLISLDSYKLVSLGRTLSAIAVGGGLAAACWAAHPALSAWMGLDGTAYARYASPVIEETAKALFLVVLIRSNRVAFLVDAGILGFATGAGFTLVENLYYLGSLPAAGFGVWLVRGFGTALMHGGVTAAFGIASRALLERGGLPVFTTYFPGLLLAVTVHSAYNHFFLSPVLSTAAVLVVLPPVVYVVFERSEKALERWLNIGFDADTELLELILAGGLSTSNVGRYLQSLRDRFRGEVVVDMACYLRVHVELSLRAKGWLMLRESGFDVPPDEETRAQLEELRFLERSIGTTGKLAMAPFLRLGAKDLWQLHLLRDGAGRADAERLDAAVEAPRRSGRGPA
ncbi:MAG: PrsW family intramembrane metalloprotease [Acidobacteriia bacterium]|nr:PrsW family intramembrane metalloprotease [Terriglobia bacterium]